MIQNDNQSNGQNLQDSNVIQEIIKQLRSDTAIQSKKPDPVMLDKIAKMQTAIDNLESKMINSSNDSFQSQQIFDSGITNGDNNQYKSAINKYLRRGTESQMDNLTNLDYNMVVDQNASGYFLSADIQSSINDHLKKNSYIRGLSSKMNISSASFESVTYETEMDAVWGDEVVALDTHSFKKRSIKLHDLTAQPKATQRTLDDAEIDIESWIGEQIGDSFLEKENEAFLLGNGITQPNGILHSSHDSINSNSVGDLSYEDFMNLYYSMSDSYSTDSVFMMHRSTAHKLRTMTDNNNNYIWSPSFSGNFSSMILGTPVVTLSKMPEINSGNKSILYINLKKAYQIIDQDGIKVQRDPFSAKPFVIFYATKRVGGDIMNTRAIKSLTIS